MASKIAKDTTLVIPPYTVTWDSTQWVVKKVADKRDGTGETEVLIGYYGYLDAALFFGLLQDTTIKGYDDVQKLYAGMKQAHKDIVEVLIQCSQDLVMATNRPEVLAASIVEPEASSTTTVSEIPSESQSMTTPGANPASLPESRPPRRRRQ